MPDGNEAKLLDRLASLYIGMIKRLAPREFASGIATHSHAC